MSASIKQLAAVHPPAERRFYPRIAPHREVPVAFASYTGTLLNVSENGLLLSTPAALDLNSVAYLTLPLNGILKPIRVLARTVWTSPAQQLSGLQLLGLAESDRRLLRKWASLQTRFYESSASFAGHSPVSPMERIPQAKTAQPLAAASAPAATTAAPSDSVSRATFRGEDPLPDGAAAKSQVLASGFADSGFNPQSTRPVLVFWSAALATILLAASWAFASSVWEKFHTGPVPAAKTAAARSRRSTASAPAAAPTVPASPAATAATAAAPDRVAAAPAGSNSRLPGMASANSSPSPLSEPLKALPASRLRPAAPSPAASPAAMPRVLNSNQSIISRTIAHAASAGTGSAASRVASDLPKDESAASEPGANPFPKTVSVDPMTREKTAILQSSNASGQNNLSAHSIPAAQPVIPAASSPDIANPAGSTQPTLNRDPAPSALSTASTDSQPRVFSLNSPSSPSYVALPGENVLHSPSLTIHIRRSVWVRGDRWFWRRRKTIALGQLSAHVAPEIPHAPRFGSVTVQATIDQTGRVAAVRPLYGSMALLGLVSRSLGQWRYQPTYVDDKPVETLANIEVDFHPATGRGYRP